MHNNRFPRPWLLRCRNSFCDCFPTISIIPAASHLLIERQCRCPGGFVLRCEQFVHLRAGEQQRLLRCLKTPRVRQSTGKQAEQGCHGGAEDGCRNQNLKQGEACFFATHVLPAAPHRSSTFAVPVSGSVRIATCLRELARTIWNCCDPPSG